MKKLLGFILVAILLVLVGIVADYSGGNISYEIKRITTLDSDGKPASQDVIDDPTSKKILKIISNLMYALAASIIITLFVTNKIEKLSIENEQKQLEVIRKEISVDVFNALFKRFMPDEIFDVVKKTIISNTIVRKDIKWDLDIKLEENEEVYVVTNIKFLMYNTGSDKHTQKSPIRSTIRDYENMVHTNLECWYGDEPLARYDHANIDNCFNVEVINSESETVLEYVLDIPGGSVVSVENRFLHRYANLAAFVYEYYSIYPIINGELCVKYPEGFDFCVFESTATRFKERKIRIPNEKRYSLNGAMLPGQGWFAHLRKLEKGAEQKTNPEPATG